MLNLSLLKKVNLTFKFLQKNQEPQRFLIPLYFLFPFVSVCFLANIFRYAKMNI